MKVKKAIKVIAALGAGISMVGATIMGAMAADLSNYPSPFVTNGVFDGLLVVGDAAAAEDVVGAIDIGTSLQYAMRQEATFGSGVAAVTISEGKKIEKTGDTLNYGDNMSDIIEVLDDEDLPVILADGRYQDSEGETTNDEKYTQTLRLYDDGGKLVFDADSQGDDKIADSYLYFNDKDSTLAYNYTLEFDSEVEYTKTSTDTPAEDLEDTVIKIQGNDYTLTDVKYSGTSPNLYVDKITLLAGETIIWLQQGKTLTRTIGGVEHEVEVTDVNDQEDMCGVSVDGDVVWIKKGQTQTINGISVGVTDAVAVHAQLQDVDICKINVGATEIVLEDGKQVEINGADVEGSNVAIANGSSTGGISEIAITWHPEDDTYLADGASLADPVLGNFEFRFAGVSKKTEEMSLITSSDDAAFTFVNNDGKEVEVPYYWNNSEVIMGDDFTASNCDGRLLLEGDICNSTSVGWDGIENVMFLLVTSGKEAHVMEIGNINSDNRTDIKDLTYSKVYENKLIDGSNLAQTGIDLGSLGTVWIGFSYPNGSVYMNATNLAAGNVIETKYGANITFESLWTAKDDNGTILVGEETDENNNYRWSMNITYYATDDELRIPAPQLTASGANADYSASDISASRSDRDTKYYVSEWGTMAEYDSNDDNDLTLWYPDEQVYGNAFVAPIGAVVSGSAGEAVTVTLNPINVGSAKLASEVAGMETSQNLIVVGGPCANDAAKVIMGLTDADDCTAGFEAGKAIIKLYENGDNVAMLVAGYNAADTRAATTVVSKYGDYADKLSGMEVEVVTAANAADIEVMAPVMS